MPGRGDETSPIPLRTRIETAARVGWEGFGLLHADLQVAARTIGLRQLRQIFEDNGIEHVELEFLSHWWAGDARRKASDRMRRELFDAAGVLGVETIKVGAELDGVPVNDDRFREEFDALAGEAGAAGTRVALEPMPMSNLPTIEAGIELVSAVSNPFAGLCVDVWHVHRGGSAFSDLPGRLPLEHVFIVELDDARKGVVGTLWDDTINERLLPGEGVFDVPRFVATMHQIGWRGHWGVEVLSKRLRQLDVDEALTQARRAALDCLEKADALIEGDELNDTSQGISL